MGPLNYSNSNYPDLYPYPLVNNDQEHVEIEKRKIHIKSYIEDKCITHRKWEEKLWDANLFIIPLIVYPILSVLGHLFIQMNRNYEYENVDNYLKGYKTLCNTKGTILIDEDIQKEILKFLNIKQKNSDPLIYILDNNLNTNESEKKVAYEIYY